jgi:hypothetical protein
MVAPVWDDELTIGLARATVEQASPAELPLFDLIAAGYRTGGMRSDARGDGAIGFGADVVTTAVAAIPVASVVGAILQAAAVELAENGVVAGVKALIGRRGQGDGEEVVALPPSVVKRARDAALEQARLLGMPLDQATLLANAVGGVLAAPS